MKNNAVPKNNAQIDPRVTFLFVFLLSAASVMLRDALTLVPVLVSAAVAAGWARAPFGTLLRRLRGLWAALLAVTLFQALFSGDVVSGLLTGAAVLERLLVLMLGGSLLAGYPGHALVQGMIQLRLPYQLAYMVSIGLRFLPRFRESFQDSLTAMQLRGVDFRRMKLRRRFKVYAYLLMPAVVSGVNSARKLSMAMELRGFGAYPERTAYLPLRMKERDWLAFAAVLLWAAALMAGQILWRIYT
ncbi:MAG: energy-coupling factor transporter transmembrane protein EcfT [Oscillospiraceae bacterium]|nr:energy-coupling factor transporter transmembrane protein EcfT [Oscillospiraceae bacterium]